MNKLKQLIRLHSQGYSKLKIAEQTGIARNTLKKYLAILTSCGLSYEELNQLSEKELEVLFIQPQEKPLNAKVQTLLGRCLNPFQQLK